MTEFKDLRGDLRPPTWAERDELDARKQDGITDVYVEPEAAPDAFWVTVIEATHFGLLGETDVARWREWEREPSRSGRRLLYRGVDRGRRD